jgi:transcription antitermination factor NusG
MMVTTYKIGDFVDFVPREPAIDLTSEQASRWYIVQTEPGREMTAQANLLIRKVPFYLPTMLKPARLPKRLHQAKVEHPDIIRPLFQGVLFVAEPVIAARYETIARTPGICARPLWRFGESVAVLTPSSMQVIRYIEAGEKELYLRQKGRAPKSCYLPKVGDEVTILLNEITGSLRGRISEVDARERITILVDLMKRQVRVHATADQITPV